MGKLSSLLPNDIVVYNHREIIDDRQFDFALLIKDVGILIIEVKGWQAKYIFDVKSPVVLSVVCYPFISEKEFLALMKNQ